MLKRLFEIVISAAGLLVGSVVLLPAMLLVWLQDRHSPFYSAPRIGRGGRPFTMLKLRSMLFRADRSGVTSTAGDDARVTTVGRWVRRWKLDELTQLWNVLTGDMSLVGPRPQVAWAVQGYTDSERELLTVKPGITDLASIVFSDEADILRGAGNPDLRYEQFIRPWKSRLALLYVRRGRTLRNDVRVLWLTALAMVARPRALAGVARLVHTLGGGEELVRVALRVELPREAPPPGASEVVRAIPSTLPTH